MLVCGGRDYKDRNRVYSELADLLSDPDDPYFMPYPDAVVIAGGASGADEIAIDWAVVQWCRFEEYTADWKRHGRGAGPIRNQRMLDEGKPDIVLAFPGGAGTADMVRRAKAAGVRVKECS